MFNFTDSLSSKELWKHFYMFTQTPRPSKKEDAILENIKKLATSHQCSFAQDTAKNLVVRVPASDGYEHFPTVIVQNHVDMVTDARPGVDFDFHRDPLITEVKDGWLTSRDTTLGADNGIGCAAALALMTDKTVKHPPLELLFTVDEETGLGGALNLDSSLLQGRKLLNLDTEEWGCAYVGCAGGANLEMNTQVQVENLAQGNFLYQLSISNFFGGHSGLDIHRQRCHALKVLLDLLVCLDQVDFGWRLSHIRAGRAHNIIARDAQICFSSKLELSQLQLLFDKNINLLKESWQDNDLNYTWSVKKITAQNELCSQVLSTKDHNRIFATLISFPHGPHSYVKDVIDSNQLKCWDDLLVDISNNLAVVHLTSNQCYILTSIRFFNKQYANILEKKIISLSRIHEFDYKKNSEYPSWPPIFRSEILSRLQDCYQQQYHSVMDVKAIHAGLECGILLSKLPEVEAVSFGPTIKGAHSPDERVNIESVEKFWNLLKTFMSKGC